MAKRIKLISWDTPKLTISSSPKPGPSHVAENIPPAVKNELTTTGFLAKSNYSRPLSLAALAIGNYLLLYVANIALARQLSAADFDDYSVALSLVTVLSTFATLGLEKYALRCIPVYRERGDWGHARGFWRFSLGATVGLSVGLVLLLASSLEVILYSRHADSHAAMLVLVAFLPAVTAVLFLVEVATAAGAQIQAVVIYRFLLPASFFVLISLGNLFELGTTAIGVGICYGLAWLIALMAIHYLVKHSMPEDFWHAQPHFLRRKWLRRAAPFLINSSMLSLMASSGVIILELLFTSESVVGTFAIAAQTGTFIVLLANTTNRFYLPLMSLYLERRDKASMRRLLAHRIGVMSGLSLLFLSVVVLLGEDILAWFGPKFRDGYPALCVLAVGASVNAMFSDSPYYLQFMKRERQVFYTSAVALVMNLGLTTTLGYYLGAVGAAYGYAISMSFLFLSQRLQASHHFARHWTSAGDT